MACEIANGTESKVACESDPCPVDCVEGWGAWSTCTGTTDGAIGSRTRTWVISTQPAYEGNPCTGNAGDLQEEVCYDCLGHFEDDGCVDGTIQQKYMVTRPSLNGANCPSTNGAVTAGTVTCSLPTVDACPGTWSSFSVCSATCGTGTRYQTWTSTNTTTAGTSACEATVNGTVTVNLDTGTINAQPCNTHACPTDCTVNVELDSASACTATCGSSTSGVFKGHAKITVPEANGGTCPYFENQHVESTVPCTGCCTPYYDWDLVRPCPGSCFNNTNVFKWTRTSVILPPTRRLLTGAPSHNPPVCQPKDAFKQEDCAAQTGYQTVPGYTDPQCCAYPGGSEGTRGQWRPSSDCNATCGYGIRNETYYVNPTPLAVDLEDTTILIPVPGQICIPNNTVNPQATCTELLPCPIDCVGSWVVTGCSDCGEFGFNVETFNITQVAMYDGSACEAAHGDTRTTSTACEYPPLCAGCNANSPPPAIQNGTWQCGDGTAHRGYCTGQCDTGYNANGTLKAECIKGAYYNITGNCARCKPHSSNCKQLALPMHVPLCHDATQPHMHQTSDALPGS
jgi:hypothetical protein